MTIVEKRPERTTGGLSVVQPGELQTDSEVTDSQITSESAFFSASVAGVTQQSLPTESMEGDSQLSRPISTETKENRKLDKKFEQRFEKFLDGIAEQEEIEKKEFEEAEKAAIM